MGRYNHLGSVALITNSAGAIFEQIRYKPYGEERGHYDASGNLQPINTCGDDGYCREYTQYDTEPISGLEYAGARFYDPALGMFLTHDPVRSAASPYGYCGGDPVNQTDPNGECPWCIAIIALAFFTVHFVLSASQAAASGANLGQSLKAGAIGGVSAFPPVGFGIAVARGQGSDYMHQMVANLTTGGIYGTVQAFEHKQYVIGSVSAVLVALELYGMYQASQQTDGLGAQPAEPGGPQGGNGAGLARAGGENESLLQKAGDYFDYYLAPKNQITPGTPEYDRALGDIAEIKYPPTREGLQTLLDTGHLYSYRPILGGAQALSGGGETFISTSLLNDVPSYAGYQLSHEYFHDLSFGLTGGPGSEWMAERFAQASNPLSTRVLQATLRQYPTTIDLYHGIVGGGL
jgi:RHS repeat-associated protein